MNQPNVNPFKKAEKERTHLRMALYGASGSGKTLTALYIAQGLGGRIAVIDTEHGNASIYGDRVNFDVLELSDYHPQRYIDAIRAAGGAGYEVLIIDSLSHAWFGSGGVLEIVDKAAAKSDSKNTYAAWRYATPLQNQLVEAIIAVPMHLICTMRSKTEFVLEPNRNGKMEPRKVGTTPIQRDGLEYEFRIVAKMNAEHQLSIDKTHYPELDGDVIEAPTRAFGERLKGIVSRGIEPKPHVGQRQTEGGASPDQPSAAVRGAGITRPIPPPVSAAANPAPKTGDYNAQYDDFDAPPDDPLADYGQELGATVITATDPRDQPEPGHPTSTTSSSVTITKSRGSTAWIFHTDDERHIETTKPELFETLPFDLTVMQKGKQTIPPVQMEVVETPVGWEIVSIKAVS